MAIAKEYEVIVLLNPDIGDEGLNKAAQRFKSIIDTQGGKLMQVNNWGKKKLAYLIDKLSQSIYLHIIYAGEPKVLVELERNLRIMDEVVRYLSIVVKDEVDINSIQAKELETLKVIHETESDNKALHEDLENEFGGMAEEFEHFEEEGL